MGSRILVIVLLAAAADAAAAEEGVVLSLSSIFWMQGGYYYHDIPGAESVELSGNGLETGIGYRSGKIYMEAAWCWARLDEDFRGSYGLPSGSVLLSRPRAGLSWYPVEWLFLHCGLSAAFIREKENHDSPWDHGGVPSGVDALLGLGLERMELSGFGFFFSWDFSYCLYNNGAYLRHSCAVIGTPEVAFLSSLSFGLRWYPAGQKNNWRTVLSRASTAHSGIDA